MRHPYSQSLETSEKLRQRKRMSPATEALDALRRARVRTFSSRSLASRGSGGAGFSRSRASSRARFQASRAMRGQDSAAKEQSRPGARFRPMSAASMARVPVPQNGSRNGRSRLQWVREGPAPRRAFPSEGLRPIRAGTGACGARDRWCRGPGSPRPSGARPRRETRARPREGSRACRRLSSARRSPSSRCSDRRARSRARIVPIVRAPGPSRFAGGTAPRRQRGRPRRAHRSRGPGNAASRRRTRSEARSQRFARAMALSSPSKASQPGRSARLS